MEFSFNIFNLSSRIFVGPLVAFNTLRCITSKKGKPCRALRPRRGKQPQVKKGFFKEGNIESLGGLLYPLCLSYFRHLAGAKAMMEGLTPSSKEFQQRVEGARRKPTRAAAARHPNFSLRNEAEKPIGRRWQNCRTKKLIHRHDRSCLNFPYGHVLYVCCILQHVLFLGSNAKPFRNLCDCLWH